jgi:hypothetical protein
MEEDTNPCAVGGHESLRSRTVEESILSLPPGPARLAGPTCSAGVRHLIREAIRTWNDLLGDNQLAADCQARLDEQQRRRGLGFGDRLLCTVWMAA